ncbi:hypothetical protein ACOMHN_009802 [Nucella lapillus]
MLSVVSTLLWAFGLLATCQCQLTGTGGSPGSTGPLSTIPQARYCSATERHRAFDRCIQNFGFQHLSHFDFLARNAPVCRVEVFRCNEMDIMMRCLNSQPTTVISNRCWSLMPEVLTQSFKDYNIPCTYGDLYKRCQNQVTKFKTLGM